MICSLLFNSASSLCGPSITSVNNNKFSLRHPQIIHSSYYPTPTNHSTKSEVSMDSMAFEFLSKKPYSPPSWAAGLGPVPSHIFSLGHVRFPFVYSEFCCVLSVECMFEFFLWFLFVVSDSNSQVESSQFAQGHRSLSQGNHDS